MSNDSDSTDICDIVSYYYLTQISIGSKALNNVNGFLKGEAERKEGYDL